MKKYISLLLCLLLILGLAGCGKKDETTEPARTTPTTEAPTTTESPTEQSTPPEETETEPPAGGDPAPGESLEGMIAP